MKLTRVAVLGPTGFAGKAVVEELQNGRFEIGVLSHQAGFDLLDMPQARPILSGFAPAYIVNCAALVGSVKFVTDEAARVLDANARMVLNLYRVARAMPGVILVNPVANCCYAGAVEHQIEGSLLDGPIHPSVLSYGETRRLMLAAAECYRSQYGVKTISLLTPNMYGPGDSIDPNKTHALNALVIKFVRAVRDHSPVVEVWGTGKPVREWLYVNDFARLVRLAIENKTAPPEPVNLAQNDGRSVEELVETILELTNYRGEVKYNPEYQDGASRRVMDDTYFKQRFPDFEFTPLETGILETIRHYTEALDNA